METNDDNVNCWMRKEKTGVVKMLRKISFMCALRAEMNEGRQVYMNIMLLMIMMYGET